MFLILFSDDDTYEVGLSLPKGNHMRHRPDSENSQAWDDVARFIRRLHIICINICLAPFPHGR